MASPLKLDDDRGKAKARSLTPFGRLLCHNGSGHPEMETEIVKHGREKSHNPKQPLSPFYC